jgi:hypothetical protein
MERQPGLREAAEKKCLPGKHSDRWPLVADIIQSFCSCTAAAMGLPGAFFVTVCNSAAQISLVKFPDGGLELPCRLPAFRFFLFQETGAQFPDSIF